ncbi:MAG: hypothetical protein AAFP15_16520 [Bacteroidota bacterium]
MTRLPVLQYPDERPRTRGECATMPRPCPFVSCRYHLAHAPMSPHAKPPLSNDEAAEFVAASNESCTLDVADSNNHPSSAEVARWLRVSEQSVQATVRRAMHRVAECSDADDLREAMRDAARLRMSAPDFDQEAPEGAVLEWSENGKAKTSNIRSGQCWGGDDDRATLDTLT